MQLLPSAPHGERSSEAKPAHSLCSTEQWLQLRIFPLGSCHSSPGLASGRQQLCLGRRDSLRGCVLSSMASPILPSATGLFARWPWGTGDSGAVHPLHCLQAAVYSCVVLQPPGGQSGALGQESSSVWQLISLVSQVERGSACQGHQARCVPPWYWYVGLGMRFWGGRMAHGRRSEPARWAAPGSPGPGACACV